MVGAATGGMTMGSTHRSTCFAANAGDQFWPPSRLSSVKMSKKLSIMKPPLSGVIVVFPGEARVGLSRTITPGGSVPPAMSSCSISVS